MSKIHTPKQNDELNDEQLDQVVGGIIIIGGRLPTDASVPPSPCLPAGPCLPPDQQRSL